MPSEEKEPSPADAQMRIAKARVGQLLCDRWRIGEVLGVGGMAAVYAATHRSGKRVAIKVLHRELSLIPAAKQRFLEEGYLANRVEHPGVVSVSDDGITADGSVFLVMELLEGEPLDARLHRKGSMDAASVLGIVDELLDILAAAHDAGVVHRDVKPGNIFLTREGRVRLLDFGIARSLDPESPRWTQAGMAMGTPAFMSPEQARGRIEELDGRSDLWSVGATMFLMLSGRQVHVAPTHNEELLAAMAHPAPSLATAVLFAPREVVRIVDQALAFEKERRFVDARRMQAEVRRVVALLRAGKTGTSSRLDLERTHPGLGGSSVDSTPAVAFAPRGASQGSGSFVRRALAGGAVAVVLVMLVASRRRHEQPQKTPPVEAPADAPPQAPSLSQLPRIAPSAPLPKTPTPRPHAHGTDVRMSSPGALGSDAVDPLRRRK
jgi:serine/threonine-protein kinase